VPDAWLTGDLSKSGVIGDARQANAELGAALQQRLVEEWVQLLEGLLGSNWPPKATQGAG
jgi:creatinine amidohydrolase